MIISVLHSLETKSDWLSFFRRDHPYCLVDIPPVLVDFQSTFLQLTHFQSDASTAIRYTLGSRSSLEPAWQLIKGCNWSLEALLEGLNSLNFNTNVRDNQKFNLPSDLSVRKSFANEARLQGFMGSQASYANTPESLALTLYEERFERLQHLTADFTPNLHSLVISLTTESEAWQVIEDYPKVIAYYRKMPAFALQLSDKQPKRHLRSQDQRF